MTERFPDIVELIPQICLNNVNSFIMDCEIVAVDSKGKIQNFRH